MHPVYGHHQSNTWAQKIESVQRRASKLLTAMTTLSYEERLHRLNLPSLKYRRRRTDLLQWYKIMNNWDTVNKAIDCSKCGNVNMFKMQSNSRTRGHQFKIKIQQTYLKRHHFFSTRVAPIWNSLPSNVVLETSVNRFKSSLSKVSSEKKLFCDYD